ncbi:MAG: tRNA (guanine37-N1)-methyltransferase [Candidatus Midichloriaceae bacterium]|jgi:tRNA (guanine37-N1)-methyltransferase
MWKVNILTLFPEIYPGPLGISNVGNALNNQWDLEIINLRDFAHDKHKTVDSPSYGGGAGMVLRADILGEAIEKKFLPNGFPIIYLSPKGSLFNQQQAKSLITHQGINIICGRFEGIDDRVLKEYNVSEVSMGDYVLSSGDLCAFAIIDSCVRLIPGVLGNDNSPVEESFGNHTYSCLLEYPHYTRPSIWKNISVPEVLLSGNHKEIDKWRLDQAKKLTKERRPDLLGKHLKGDKNESS